MTEQDHVVTQSGVIHRNGGQPCGELRQRHGVCVSYDVPAASVASDRIAGDLSVIGWSVVQAEKRSGIGRNRISRWLSGVAPEASFVRWLGHLAKWHDAWSTPLLKPLENTSNRPPMRGREFYRVLLVIGCSERLIVARMGHNRAAFRAALATGGHLTQQESQWLRYLELGHLAYPSPVASSSLLN